MTGDGVWQQEGTHYRDLATRLREIARECPRPYPQRELLDLAQQYERRADHMDHRAAFIRTKFDPSHG
jgi:hypothetical protein